MLKASHVFPVYFYVTGTPVYFYVTGVGGGTGQCGSCWAFGTTGDIEGAAFIASGALRSLSEQQLVSCDTDFNNGCGGGRQEDAFDYVMGYPGHSGLTTEKNYPYLSGDGKEYVCLNDYAARTPLTHIKTWEQVL